MARTPRIAVVIPCRDEASTIGGVVEAFGKALPGAAIHVYENGSRDETAAEARAAGALVRSLDRPGKGNAVRRAFADIEADVYVLVDGDGTYDAGIAPGLVAEVLEHGHDLANGARLSPGRQGAFRAGHRVGNAALSGIVGRLFGEDPGDMLSGYKALSRRLVKSFPARSQGFEIETELTVHALELKVPRVSIDGAYRERPAGSESKLRTWSDGVLISRMILRLVRHVRPLAFFAAIAALLAAIGIGFGVPVVIQFFHTHRVPRLPTAVLATGLELLAALSLTAGLVLDTVTRARLDGRVLAYLSIPGPLANGGETV